jgi:uncharacterized membrane protein
MKLKKDVNELLEARIIDQETADKIQAYYNSKTGSPQSKLVIVFGILGAILVGLGIILILAHNWDDLTKTAKTIIAFCPLVIAHFIAGYSLLRREESIAWRESSAAFLVISIGACISLISQIYNIAGSMSSFLLTWILLSLPVVYVMRSSVVSLLYIGGITWYACENGYWSGEGHESVLYWLLLLLVLPHYYFLYRNQPHSNFFTFHNWFIPISVTTALGIVAREDVPLMFIAYVSLFAVFYLIGHFPMLREQHVRNNGYLCIGSLGTVSILLALSFDFIWSELRDGPEWSPNLISTPEFIASAILTLAAAGLLIYQKLKENTFMLRPVEPVFILFIIIFLIGMTSPMAVVLTNFLVLAIGIMTIREGARYNHFGILNYGLLIIAALVICRFFDTNLGFVIKGFLFVLVGLGFFFANYWMMKKRKATPPVANAIPPEVPEIK